jgi:hypothetical protein
MKLTLLVSSLGGSLRRTELEWKIKMKMEIKKREGSEIRHNMYLMISFGRVQRLVMTNDSKS